MSEETNAAEAAADAVAAVETTTDQKMSWELLAMLILKEGVPLAIKLAQKWGTKTAPTEADYNEILAISQQTSKDRLSANLVSLGFPLDSERAKELLTLLK